MKILVVDDEAPIRDWIVYSIEREGDPFHVVGAAKSGQEAYDMVVEHKPEVIITDIKMPGIDGIELMKMVKQIQPYTVFIILTNYAEFSYAKKAITYGAKEYLLKSELRSSDLIDILDQSYQEQIDLLRGKKSEVFSTGYVDLYNLYQNIEDQAYHRKFWLDLGMTLDRPYGILGIWEDMDINQRQILGQLARQIAPSYFNIALRNQSIYIIIQEDNYKELEATMSQYADLYFQSAGKSIVIGESKNRLEDFLQAIEEVEATLMATFFERENKIIKYQDLLGAARLDKKTIRKEYKNILSSLSFKRYEEVMDQLEAWFNYFTTINIKDIAWARDRIIKLVIGVEEKFYQYNSEYEDSGSKTKQLTSIDICRKLVRAMVEKMAQGTGGVKSTVINEALNFIHENFNQDISLVMVANHIYRSPEYFSRLFKDEVGVNFSIYLTMHRLNHAKRLISTTDLQISQIAQEVGYGNPGYFSRIYKKYMGLTPEEFRSQKSIKRSK